MKALFGSKERFLDLSLLILRFGLAFEFLYAGTFKIANHMTAEIFAEMLHLPAGLFLMIGVLEVLSGVGVLFGLLTRPSAIYQIIILLGAIFVVGRADIFTMQMAAFTVPDLGLLTMPIVLLLYGPGRYSIDTKLAGTSPG